MSRQRQRGATATGKGDSALLTKGREGEALLSAEDFSEAYQLCDRIAGMLSGLLAKR